MKELQIEELDLNKLLETNDLPVGAYYVTRRFVMAQVGKLSNWAEANGKHEVTFILSRFFEKLLPDKGGCC